MGFLDNAFSKVMLGGAALVAGAFVVGSSVKDIVTTPADEGQSKGEQFIESLGENTGETIVKFTESFGKGVAGEATDSFKDSTEGLTTEGVVDAIYDGTKAAGKFTIEEGSVAWNRLLERLQEDGVSVESIERRLGDINVTVVDEKGLMVRDLLQRIEEDPDFDLTGNRDPLDLNGDGILDDLQP